MNELRLLFSRSGADFTYRIVPSWGDGAGEAQPFAAFLDDKDYEDLRWYLEDYMELSVGGAKVRAERVERSLGEWGKKLFDAVFGSGDHRDLYRTLERFEGSKLLTIGTKDLDILRLPWELMADDRGPLTRRRITIRRQLETARPSIVFPAAKLPLRILLAVSRPDDAGFLDPRHTTRAMLEALAPLGAGVEVDFCRPATLARMERMLADADGDGRPYQIVHFVSSSSASTTSPRPSAFASWPPPWKKPAADSCPRTSPRSTLTAANDRLTYGRHGTASAGKAPGGSRVQRRDAPAARPRWQAPDP